MGLPPSSLTFVPRGGRGLVTTTFMVQPVPAPEGLALLSPGYKVSEEGNQMIRTTPS